VASFRYLVWMTLFQSLLQDRDVITGRCPVLVMAPFQGLVKTSDSTNMNPEKEKPYSFFVFNGYWFFCITALYATFLHIYALTIQKSLRKDLIHRVQDEPFILGSFL